MTRRSAQTVEAPSGAAAIESMLAEERVRRAVAEDQRDEFQRMNDAKTRLLSLISHELKTPLTGISAFAELLGENNAGNLSDRQLQQVMLIQRSADQLAALINGLLDFSRLDAGVFKLEMNEFDPRVMLLETAAAVEPILAHNDQRLDVRIGDAPLRVRGDRTRLAQVVSNLLTNAAKFSPSGACVQLTACSDDGAFRMRVSDHGIGITAEDQPQLFKPFFRANNAETRSAPGTGLGLYIAHSIVRLHDGTISVESDPGRGSRFTVDIPSRQGCT